MIYQPARDKRPVESRCDDGLLSSGKDQQFIPLQAQFALNHASPLARPGMHPMGYESSFAISQFAHR